MMITMPNAREFNSAKGKHVRLKDDYEHLKGNTSIKAFQYFLMHLGFSWDKHYLGYWTEICATAKQYNINEYYT